MSDDRVTETTIPHTTTIIERRGSGAGMLIGIAVILAVLIAGLFLFNQSKNESIETKAISSAAKSVGDTADKAGQAIDKAVE